MIQKFFIIVVMVCLLPVSAVFGQQLKKENLKGTNAANPGRDYAVFYSAGIPESAIWPLGMKLSKDAQADVKITPPQNSLKGVGVCLLNGR